jgi:hypothetical protein
MSGLDGSLPATLSQENMGGGVPHSRIDSALPVERVRPQRGLFSCLSMHSLAELRKGRNWISKPIIESSSEAFA